MDLSKLKFKGDVTIFNAPEGIVSTSLVENTNEVLAFIRNKAELQTFLDNELSKCKYDALLWFAYPKGTSGIKTDINRDILWKLAEPYGIRPVSMVSLDGTWSAIRFRPIEVVKTSK